MDRKYIISFLNTKIWNKTIATNIAYKLGIKKLSYIHFKIIYFIRIYYYSFNSLPTYRLLMNYIVYNTKIKNFNTSYFYKLFPKGLGEQALKISGFINTNKCI